VLLRGILYLVVGFLLVTSTGDAAQVLVQFFGLLAIVEGILVGIAAIVARKELGQTWWHSLLHGLLSFAIGLILLWAPGITIGVVVYLIAIWALVVGAIQLLIAWQIRKETDFEFLLVITGLISLLFGWVLFRNPAEVTEFILVLVGIFMVFSGIALTVFGVKLKGWGEPA
jgi:uncharacterized membrane protein HdeD (DUF308 family)